MGMSPATPLSVGMSIPNDSDLLSDAGEGLTVTFSDGGVMMVGSDVSLRIQDTRVTYLAGTGSLQYVSGTGTPHILSVPGGEVQLLGTDISVVPQSALASSVMVYDGRIVATARDGSNALVPSETETGGAGEVVLLSTLSATTGEASKLSPTDPIITQHQGHVFEDRTRDPQQMEAITQNPKAVPFVTQMPVYTGTSVPAVGQSFEMTVTFNKPVVVTGLPSLRLVLTASPSGETRYATYVGGSGTNTLTFRWDPVDVVGITGFEVTQIDQSSGSIASADGSERAESFVPSTTFAMPSYSIAVSPSVIDYTNQNSVILNVANYGSGNMAVVSLNGNALPPVPAAASIPLDVTGLPDGPITIEYYEIAGTQTLLSVSATATKDISDTIPPTVSLDPITSPSANTTQTLTGTVSDNLGTPSVQVRLSPSGITQGATVTGTAPNYTWTATVSGLSDDTYTVTARATDGMGNITDTAPQTLSINTAAPSATLSTIAGSVYTGAQILTNDATPTLTGTATGGGSATVSQVDISLDGGTTWSPATGTANWTYTPSANLTDIIYSVQVRVTNSVGTQSVTPFENALQVDATAPTVSIAITSPSAGTYTTGQVITATATFSESVTGTATLPFSVNGVATSPQTCTGTGTTRSCSYTIQGTDSGAITIAANALTGTLNDAAGNTAILTHDPVTPSITADTAAFTVSSVAVQAGGGNGAFLTSATPTLRYTFSEAVSASSLSASDFTPSSGSVASVSPVGSTPTTQYDVAFSGLSQGSLSVAISAGSITSQSASKPIAANTNTAYTVDSIAPSVSFTGSSSVISASSTTLDGTASDASGIASVTATSGTGPACSMSGTTSWTCALNGITAGTYTYTAIATDIAGNTTTSTSFSLTRSTSAPTLSLSSSTPTLPTAGGLTNATTLSLSFTATPTGGATSISSVEVSTDGTTYSVPTIFSAGTWNTATLSLTNGSTYTLKARATDNLGNVSSILDIDSFTVDRTAPTLSASTPIVLSGNGTCGTLCSVGNVITATVSFTESVTDTPGLTLQVGSSERTMTCSTDTGSTRTCTYTLTGSDDGSISILANKLTGTLSDLAGNAVASLNHSAVSSPSLTIDTTAPAAPTAPDLAAASDSGVNTDNTTNINPVTFTGTAEAGSTVSLYAQTGCGGSAVATTTGGSYTFTGVALTANAITTFSAKATDAAGNASPCSSNLAVTHDTTAPTGTVDTLSTPDTTPPLSGNLGETGLTVSVTVNSQGPYAAAVSGTTWTLADNTITPALTVGTYNVTLTITDAAGNGGADSTTNELTVTADCPNIGNVCSDGSIYAGLSPDGTKAMFTTIAANENSGIVWNDNSANWRDTSLANCSSSESTCRTGKSNSSTLATEDSSSAAGIQPHNAAQYCENLTAHGQTDWYLPAKDELNVLYTNRTAIGGFTSNVYWSSSEIGTHHAWEKNVAGGTDSVQEKFAFSSVRCVRRVN
jgi:hypothetical protein